MGQYVPPDASQTAAMTAALDKCANALTESQTYLQTQIGFGSQTLAFITGNSDNLDKLQQNWNQFNTWAIQLKQQDFNDVLAGNTSMDYFFQKVNYILSGCSDLEGVTGKWSVDGISSAIATDVKTSVGNAASGLANAGKDAVNNAAFGLGVGLVAIAAIYLLYIYAVSRVAAA